MKTNDEKYLESEALVTDGMTVKDAVKKTGISLASFYTRRNKANKAKRANKKTPKIIAIPKEEKSNGKMILLMGATEDVMSALRSLQ